MSLKTEDSGEFIKSEPFLLPYSQASFHVLINAINKYEQAVKQHIDPEINSEDAILLLANMIEKLTNSLLKNTRNASKK
ncbi:hypothetical protein [Scytonema sp. NUACC26]|uniref:hypothetical protein n=1 Tax=Scytonema sp. NUACC26 TaxID=3140176 RepID=UPI0034DBB201